MLRRLAIVLAFALSTPSVAGGLPPDALVRRVTADVLDAIGREKESHQVDRASAIAIAEEKILPHVDFVVVTQLAVGKSWRIATPTQQAALVKEFRTLLVRTYATALEGLRGQRVEEDPVRMSAGDVEVRVRNRYLKSRTPPVPIDYLMHKTPDCWKVYDIVVEGVSLVLTYRTNFEEEVRRGGIDGLVARLEQKNRELRSGDGGTAR
jgi:phospholipid transport system substrate-binding protein